MAVKVFVVGGTGYQGSTLLQQLKAHKKDYEVTTMTRKDEQAERLKSQGFKTVKGSFSDVDVLRQAAQEADVVFNLASADNLDLVKTLVQAIKPKGKKGIFVHTSGTGVLTDDAGGNFKSEKVYSDKQPQEIEELPDTQPHQVVDNWIRANAQDITFVIACPPLIYGLAGDPKRLSVQIPTIVRGMYGAQKAACIGKGVSMWNYVHVVDLAHFYIGIATACLERNGDTAGLEGLYFVEAGEFQWKDLFKAVADAMEAMGPMVLPAYKDLAEFTEQEMEEHMAGAELTRMLLGSNARCKAERARDFWRPTQEPVFEVIAAEVDRVYHAGDIDRN